jgi:hypothetical protein
VAEKSNPYVITGRNWKTKHTIYEHRTVIEKALGHKIPKGAVTHHIDGDKRNNAKSNLVLCPSQKYHYLLHIRKTALEACGNKHWRKCVYCAQHGDAETMKPIRNGSFYHRECSNANRRMNRKKERGITQQ